MVPLRSHLGRQGRKPARLAPRVFYSVLFLLAASLAWPAGMAAQTNSVLDGWFAAQNKVQTWSADFIQTRTLKTLTQPLLAKGRVFVALPDRFRWELGTPAQTIALRQTDNLYVIYPRLKRAERYSLTDKTSGQWKDALGLLEASFPKNKTELDAHFRVIGLTNTSTGFLLSLEPKNVAARRILTQIQVGFRTNDFSLASTEMNFIDGSSLRNDFTNAVVNPQLATSVFEATFDPDYTVVEPLRH